ncbi:hypothetical protein JW926_11670 [Candidatus Sumerlaeota bacterium]|nr:hypothetical protein [Candidatus Sumerlaeota bacterium]
MNKRLFIAIFIVFFPMMGYSASSYGSKFDKYTTYPSCLIEVPLDFLTIQEAIDEAAEGCEIIVAPGIYMENLEFNGNNIILRSTNPEDSSTVENTIIDGGGIKPVITMDGDELTTCVIAGFTIMNGAASSGGGIDGNGGRVTIKNNIITQNAASTAGGGIYNCHGLILNNIISENAALKYGGGISYSLGTIRHNIIRENYALYGGGLYQGFGAIQNNLITGNQAANEGGGLYKCAGTVQNCVIAFNEACSGAGLYDCSGVIQNNTVYSNLNSGSSKGAITLCTGTIVNCVIWNNAGINLERSSIPFYSCIQDWTGGGRGNIALDPRLSDPLNGDFHLLGDSPCIDAGNKRYLFGEYLADMDGECRVAGSSVDMGSDEYGSKKDQDGDLLNDDDETTMGTDMQNPDTDSDGLMDGVEISRETQPLVADEPYGIQVTNSSIQEAVFLAFPNEEIILNPGIYRENIHILNKNIVLSGSDPNNGAIVESTILDGEDFFSVIALGGKESPRCVIRGLTIRNGTSFQGGGIAGKGALPLIEKNRIVENAASGDYAMGGGIHGCNGMIRKNIISNNIATGLGSSGGGLASCNGMIHYNIISSNSAERHGGGLVLCGFQGSIQNNIITNNETSYYGGGLSSSDTKLVNNIIINNKSDYLGGGLHAVNGHLLHNTICGNECEGEGGGMASCRGAIKNCILWGNVAPLNPQMVVTGDAACSLPSYSCIQDWQSGGMGNISANPLFVDPVSNDFHLQSISPCLDAGALAQDVLMDFEGDPRPFDAIQWEVRGDGSDYDMGADEAVIPAPSPTPTPTPTPSPTPFMVVEYDFPNDAQGWTPHTISPPYSPAKLGWIPGALSISSVDDNTVGYWDSPSEGIPLEEGYLYRGRFWISTDVEDKQKTPQIRLRTLSNHLQKTDILEISSSGSGEYSPTREAAPYDLYFTASLCSNDKPDSNRILLSFDLVNLNSDDAATGTVYLRKARVEGFPTRALKRVETAQYWDFEGPKPSRWLWNEVASAFTPPFHEESKGGLFMRGRDACAYGFWSTNPSSLFAKNNVLYKASYLIKTDEEDQSLVPGIRLRFNTITWESGAGMEIYSIGEGDNSPTPQGRTYHHYYMPPQGLDGYPSGRLQLSFDLKSFDLEDRLTSTFKLEQTAVDIYEIPK